MVVGVVLIWLAIRRIRARPASNAAEAGDRPGMPAAFLSIYGMTMTNPMTILSFAGIFAGIGLAGHGALDAALLTGGGFLGSSVWWVLLTAIIGWLPQRITP